MIAFVDVQYAEASARAACVLARAWSDAEPAQTLVADLSPIAPYEPGAFYKRELPCLLAVLARAPEVEVVVIDGYVWLDESMTPGLGAHLYEALGKKVPVVGVAKTAFKGSPMAEKVLRPSSAKPLFVTSVGLPASEAAAHVRAMHGDARIPTLLRRVDDLARGRFEP